ncbi:hypothetical protein [Streptomyces sp. NPDC059850]|uniref:hypothetical protein n=1 Tax=Streptomyces sp. NPDC059850 TaxID=3346970 RepID=UPI0036543568
MTADPHAQVPTFRDVLNLLLQAQAKEDPKRPGTFVELTNQEIADAINAKYGVSTITGEYVRKLRKGDIKSPSIQMASVLAGFFQLPLDVFNATGSETSKKVVEEVQRFVDGRRRTLSEEPEPPTVRALARTTRRLSPDGQARVVRYAQQLEQLEAMENETRPHVDPSSN